MKSPIHLHVSSSSRKANGVKCCKGLRRAGLFLLAIFLGFVAISYSADDDFYNGRRNFQKVLRIIAERYEDPQYDPRKIVISALQSLEHTIQSEDSLAEDSGAETDDADPAMAKAKYESLHNQHLRGDSGEADPAQEAGEPAPDEDKVESGTSAYEDADLNELFLKIDNTISGAVRDSKEIGDATRSEATILWNATIAGLVEGLDDPYSQYLPPKELGKLNKFLSGESDPDDIFYGVGIHIEWDIVTNQGLLVIAPLPDSPAFLNDIQPGDIIIAVDGVPIETDLAPDANLERARQRIIGPKGTKVTLTIHRKGTPVPLQRELERAPVHEHQRIIRNMLDEENGVGYIRLINFHQNSANEVEDALIWLHSMGMKKLILDFRWNPGGFLDQAIAIADLFMKKGDLLTYTQGRSDEDRNDFNDLRDSRYGFEDLDVVILINEYSASASEVVSGALKDSGRCKVVGMKSFGKGSVQEIFPLNAGAALRLTVAKYYSPAGNCIHGKGIQPDYVVPRLDQDMEGNEIQADQDDSQEDVDSDKQAEESEPKHYDSLLSQKLDIDPQLRKAYLVLMGIEESDSASLGSQ